MELVQAPGLERRDRQARVARALGPVVVPVRDLERERVRAREVEARLWRRARQAVLDVGEEWAHAGRV